MDDDMILSYNDVVLRRSDLGILSGPKFLNDRIIEFYFSYLSSFCPSEDILLVPPAIAFWISACPDVDSIKDFVQPLNLSTKKLVFFPVNDNPDPMEAEGGSHWSLLVFEREFGVFVHHDSIFGQFNNLSSAKRLYKAVFPFMGISESKGFNGDLMDCPSTPRQVNGYDCGLYVLAIARTICIWYASDDEVKDEDFLWVSAVEEQVTPYVVSQLRHEILELITSLREEKK